MSSKGTGELLDRLPSDGSNAVCVPVVANHSPISGRGLMVHFFFLEVDSLGPCECVQARNCGHICGRLWWLCRHQPAMRAESFFRGCLEVEAALGFAHGLVVSARKSANSGGRLETLPLLARGQRIQSQEVSLLTSAARCAFGDRGVTAPHLPGIDTQGDIVDASKGVLFSSTMQRCCRFHYAEGMFGLRAMSESL